MIAGISAQLSWRDDADVRAVLFEGAGRAGSAPAATCGRCGALVLDGTAGRGDGAIFAAEYRMNAADRDLPKPVIALCRRASSWAAASALPAMPASASPARRRDSPCRRAAIGFVCDVGVNAILAQGAGAPGAAVPDERAAGRAGRRAGARADRLRRAARRGSTELRAGVARGRQPATSRPRSWR